MLFKKPPNQLPFIKFKRFCLTFRQSSSGLLVDNNQKLDEDEYVTSDDIVANYFKFGDPQASFAYTTPFKQWSSKFPHLSNRV